MDFKEEDLKGKDRRELTKKEVVAICGMACLLMLACAGIAIFLERDVPGASIHDLYVPGLVPAHNKTTTFNTTVFVDLKFERSLTLSRPKFTDLQMTLFYGKDWQLLAADHIIEGFSMGRSKRVIVKAAVDAPRLPWEEMSRAVAAGEEVSLVLQFVMNTCGRNKCSWWSNRHAWVFAVRVQVDASGHMVGLWWQ